MLCLMLINATQAQKIMEGWATAQTNALELPSQSKGNFTETMI